mmetsp:Transcript_24182/g.61869  ORF Transcript_24182/g.61869 Transcript_24182/m.61869 type:complete len:212 (-) Transcript_24182:1323-1958(-)
MRGQEEQFLEASRYRLALLAGSLLLTAGGRYHGVVRERLVARRFKSRGQRLVHLACARVPRIGVAFSRTALATACLFVVLVVGLGSHVREQPSLLRIEPGLLRLFAREDRRADRLIWRVVVEFVNPTKLFHLTQAVVARLMEEVLITWTSSEHILLVRVDKRRVHLELAARRDDAHAVAAARARHLDLVSFHLERLVFDPIRALAASIGAK